MKKVKVFECHGCYTLYESKLEAIKCICRNTPSCQTAYKCACGKLYIYKELCEKCCKVDTHREKPFSAYGDTWLKRQ